MTMTHSSIYRRSFLIFVCVLISAGLFAASVGLVPVPHPASPSAFNRLHSAALLNTYGKLPLAFEVNQGQADSSVKFLSHGNGYALFLTGTGPVLAFSNKTGQQVLRLNLVGATSHPQVVGLDELPGKTNYFLGNDPRQWLTNVPTYARVLYRNVYPGVNLVYYGNQGSWGFPAPASTTREAWRRDRCLHCQNRAVTSDTLNCAEQGTHRLAC